MRYVLEGEWTGYTLAQRRVVHREVLTEKEKLRLEHLHCIVYTDDTSLILSIRDAKPREKVKTNHQYNSLIREAAARGGSRVLVADLVFARIEEGKCPASS